MNRTASLTVHLSHYFCNYFSGIRYHLIREDKQPIGSLPSVRFLDMNIYFPVRISSLSSSFCIILFLFFFPVYKYNELCKWSNVNWITTRREENQTWLTETKILLFVLTCSNFALIQFLEVLNFIIKAFKLKNRSFLYKNIWGFSFFGTTDLNSKWYCLQKYFESYNAPFWQRIMYYIQYFFVLPFFSICLIHFSLYFPPEHVCNADQKKHYLLHFMEKNGKSYDWKAKTRTCGSWYSLGCIPLRTEETLICSQDAQTLSHAAVLKIRAAQ